MKKIIKWDAKNGKKIEVGIELILSEKIWADGDAVDVSKVDIKVMAYADGDVVGSGRPIDPIPAAKKAAPGCAGMIGKLVIMPENMTKINAAIAEMEATPEWVAKQNRIAEAEKIDIEYDAHRAKMAKIMGY
jgi:hypothetical protein